MELYVVITRSSSLTRTEFTLSSIPVRVREAVPVSDTEELIDTHFNQDGFRTAK